MKGILFQVLAVSTASMIYTGEYLLPKIPMAPVLSMTKEGNTTILRDADTSEDAAWLKCKEFYTKRDEIDDDIKISYLGGGGQSRVYKCETNTPDSKLPAVALKLYMRPWELNMPEREVVDTQLGNLKIGPTVYEFFYTPDYVNSWTKDPAGKIEDVLSGHDLESSDLPNPVVYKTVAKLFAQVHSISREEMPVEERFGKEIWPWNTKLILDHLNQPWFSGKPHKKIWKHLGMNTSLEEEFNFADNKIRESKTPTTFCHNDPHNGNIMIDNDENDNLRPDTMMLIDFDNAAWGYRAWDIDYYFSKWPVWPTTAVMEDFADAYLEEFNQNGVKLTKDELMLELRYHQPYVLLEQMLFYYVFLDGYKSPAHLNAYCDVMLNYFQRSGWSVNM